VSTSDGDVVALRRRTGVELWRQDALKRRRLAAPGSIGGYVAEADFEGYVHWLDKASGALVARTKAGDRVSNPPLVAGELLLTVDDAGRITAFRPRLASAAAPAAESAPAAEATPPAASGSPAPAP